MSLRRDDDVDDGPLLGRYALLRKNFIQELTLSTIFLLCFTMSFLIGWDLYIVPLDYHPSSILYCLGTSLAIAIIITVPLGVMMKYIAKSIERKKQQKNQEKNEKDFLDS